MSYDYKKLKTNKSGQVDYYYFSSKLFLGQILGNFSKTNKGDVYTF